MIKSGNKNMGKNMKVLDHYRHPVKINCITNAPYSSAEYKIINMKDKILENLDYCDFLFFGSCDIGKVDEKIDYERIMRMTLGKSYNNFLALLNSIFVEQKNLFFCVEYVDLIITDFLTYMLFHVDYTHYDIDFDFNEYIYDEILKDIKKCNKDKKIIIIRKSFLRCLNAKDKQKINYLSMNAKKYNANVIIETKQIDNVCFKRDYIQINFDSSKLNDYVKQVDCGRQSIDKYNTNYRLLDKCRPDFFNWFLKKKLFK